MPAQNGQLVAQHEDLGVLGDGVHPVDPDQLDDASDQAVEEAECPRAEPHRARRPWSSPEIE